MFHCLYLGPSLCLTGCCQLGAQKCVCLTIQGPICVSVSAQVSMHTTGYTVKPVEVTEDRAAGQVLSAPALDKQLVLTPLATDTKPCLHQHMLHSSVPVSDTRTTLLLRLTHTHTHKHTHLQSRNVSRNYALQRYFSGGLIVFVETVALVVTCYTVFSLVWQAFSPDLQTDQDCIQNAVM